MAEEGILNIIEVNVLGENESEDEDSRSLAAFIDVYLEKGGQLEIEWENDGPRLFELEDGQRTIEIEADGMAFDDAEFEDAELFDAESDF